MVTVYPTLWMTVQIHYQMKFQIQKDVAPHSEIQTVTVGQILMNRDAVMTILTAPTYQMNPVHRVKLHPLKTTPTHSVAGLL